MQPTIKIKIYGGHVETEDCSHKHPPEVPTDPCEDVAEAREKAPVIHAGETSLAMDQAILAQVTGAYRHARSKGRGHRGAYSSALRVAERVRKDPKGSEVYAEKAKSLVMIEEQPARDTTKLKTIERDPEEVKRAKAFGQIMLPHDVYRVVGEQMSKERQEVLGVLVLDLNFYLNAMPIEVARGQRSMVGTDMSDVLGPVVVENGDYCILWHNHPSGSALPSEADRDLTKAIEKAIKRSGYSFQLLDHCVVGLDQIYSIKRNKLYEF